MRTKAKWTAFVVAQSLIILAALSGPSIAKSIQSVFVSNTSEQPVPVAGAVDVANLPAVQEVSGNVAVTNLPSSQKVTGSVGIDPDANAVTVDASSPLPVEAAAPIPVAQSGEWTISAAPLTPRAFSASYSVNSTGWSAAEGFAFYGLYTLEEIPEGKRFVVRYLSAEISTPSPDCVVRWLGVSNASGARSRHVAEKVGPRTWIVDGEGLVPEASYVTGEAVCPDHQLGLNIDVTLTGDLIDA